MECTICLNDINNGCCKQLRCGHIFHKSCIHTWFNTSNSCPTCRNKVFELKTEQQLYDDWYRQKSEEYTDVIESVFNAFDQELEEEEIPILRKLSLQTLYENLSDLEYFFAKFINLCDYLNEDIDIEGVPEIYELYGYAFEMIKQTRIHERCITESFINLNPMTNKIVGCW